MRHISATLGSLLVLGGLLGACASPDGAGSAGGAPPAAPPQTRLTVTVASTAQATALRWTLTCDPTGGTLPRAADACSFIARTPPKALAPVPAQTACTMIYGGPQVATVKGTWRGSAVDARFSRTNGCEVSRWTSLKPLLGDPA